MKRLRAEKLARRVDPRVYGEDSPKVSFSILSSG